VCLYKYHNRPCPLCAWSVKQFKFLLAYRSLLRRRIYIYTTMRVTCVCVCAVNRTDQEKVLVSFMSLAGYIIRGASVPLLPVHWTRADKSGHFFWCCAATCPQISPLLSEQKSDCFTEGRQPTLPRLFINPSHSIWCRETGKWEGTDATS